MMCGTVQDLQGCPVPLIQLEEEDIWEASLLESVGEEPVASLTPAEKALLLSEDPEARVCRYLPNIFPSGQKRLLSQKSQPD